MTEPSQVFEPLYTAAEMRAAEERYPGYPRTIPELMERAGRAVAEEAMKRYPDARTFTAVCGQGANGGDGRVALEVLRASGRSGAEHVEGEAFGATDVLIDALFGTGFRGEPRREAAARIAAVNASGSPVLSVDIPSGVDASTGEVAGTAVRSDATVTFHGPKVGLYVAPGRFHAGDVVVADIGLDHAETRHRLVTKAILERVARKRASDNKYSAGSVLVVGGEPGYTGAACLAARAAFRADAGYVAIAAPRESLPTIETLVVEAVKRPLEQVFEAAERASALALGPGLGRSPERGALIRRLLDETGVPAVVDADALFGLEPFERDAPTVLTPHEGELARLLGRDSAWVRAH
ncbi:MAG: bifunctional ADP-dependent NAD(P)H-hydrate dehydratase/NAD(P)H-hydrate epimerase, partial [Actinomycetota bacterium]|nr:bifunctional ADP-dependent NAD(P)H-hydrate dehydratase/NAD(P)H-hydrate epimerase [Actinomycetota bacterium]